MSDESKAKTRQHYVPQFYLRNFGEEEQVHVFDKVTKRSPYLANVRDIGQERYFYALPTDGAPTVEAINVVENFLETIDDESGRTINALLKRIEESKGSSHNAVPSYQLRNDEKLSLAKFMVYQYVRTREFREKISQMGYQLTKAIVDLFMEQHEPKFKDMLEVEMRPEKQILQHIQMITDKTFMDKLTRGALNKHWMIGYCTGDKSIIASDHPVAMRGHNPNPFLNQGVGWDSPYAEIIVPLNPKVVLLLVCKKMWMEGEHAIERTELTEDKILPILDEHVEYCNQFQVLGSNQFIYAKSVDHFNSVETILERDPEASNKYRKRAEVSGKTYPLPENWASRSKRPKRK